MKLLQISRGGLELARAHLTRPLVTIGRSPTCDVVLRASGVAPVHFLLEWVGAGAFDPDKGSWSIFDVSSSEDASGEGLLLKSETVRFRDFSMGWVEDRLEASPEIGGSIRDSLAKAGVGGSVLELVAVRSDSGAIEDVLHLSSSRPGRIFPVLERTPEFKIQWPKEEKDAAVQVILSEMPGATVLKRGVKVESGSACALDRDDVLQVTWKGRVFHLRFVGLAEIPKVERKLLQDPTLRVFAVIGLILLLLLLLLYGVSVWTKTEDKVIKEPPRVARVEVKQIITAVPPPPSLAAPETPPPEAAAPTEVPAPPKPSTPRDAPRFEGMKPNKNPGMASAPRFRGDAQAPKNLGLNSPAPVTNVNSIGILGALGGGGAKGPGVRADKIINDGLITESVSGPGHSGVVVRNPPAGTLGTGAGGSATGSGPGLSAASTTMTGAKEFDAASTGPIAQVGGKSGYGVGTGLGGDGTGAGAGKGAAELGSIEVGGMSVSGGLDRETVRRVIASYRNQIRTCYENALLSKSKLQGRILYTWMITSAGPVSTAEITKTTVGSPPLEGCVLEVIKGMNFPVAPNGQNTKVIYPFEFQSK